VPKSPVYERAISLPFRIDDFGNIASTISQEKIWADRVRSAVGTRLNERVLTQEYGTEIPAAALNSADLAITSIEEEVETAFIRDLPTLELESVIAAYDESTGVVSAEVSYFLPSKEQTSVVIGIATLLNNNPIQEELL
jgi:phage baseplate assembly protein W